MQHTLDGDFLACPCTHSHCIVVLLLLLLQLLLLLSSSSWSWSWSCCACPWILPWRCRASTGNCRQRTAFNTQARLDDINIMAASTRASQALPCPVCLTPRPDHVPLRTLSMWLQCADDKTTVVVSNRRVAVSLVWP